jgi:Tetrapyrrole (Corrin/Porphyrin) Methylases
MLTDFFLNIINDPARLKKLKSDRANAISDGKVSSQEAHLLASGQLEELRRQLYKEATSKRSPQPPLASDFTVSTSCDTPHCPVNASGFFDSSFWEVRNPDHLWDSKGLTVVGTGIRAGLQTTPESLECIRSASKVLFLVADLVSHLWIQKLTPTAESMHELYEKGTHRLNIYNRIVDRILATLRREKDLCVVFYGHPGAFVYPAHEAIRLARAEGFMARMLPGVSAEANLLSDLGVDPGVVGIQSYEATNFLLNKYRFDTSAGLILWQIGLFGYSYWDPEYKANTKSLDVLVGYLADHYGASHEVVLYEAAEFPLAKPTAERLPLSRLPQTRISGVATLYIPPKSRPSTDLTAARELGVPVAQ